ncbi:MAG: hypothetical protein IT163_03605 [Bryobacterales bacterium]|nr:hypothetical protein [Bryobacterales bacterium]
MFPTFLVEDGLRQSDGASAVLDVSGASDRLLLLTLGITRIIEQESLDIGIWGSADGEKWAEQPLLSFPQKFYCGTYAIVLDLTAAEDVKYIQARWKMNRWGRGVPAPLFGFYLVAGLAKVRPLAAAGA